MHENWVSNGMIITIPMIILFVLEILLDDEIRDKLNKKMKWSISIVLVIIAGLIATSLYVQWSPLRWYFINGIQGRYFLPFLLPLVLLFGQNKWIKQNGKINGSYKNQDGSSIIGIMGSSNNYYKDTYDTYTHVDKNAVPLYWQTNATIETGSGATFNHYFILRLYIGNKKTNDRETDIICIAARVFSSQMSE